MQRLHPVANRDSNSLPYTPLRGVPKRLVSTPLPLRRPDGIARRRRPQAVPLIGSAARSILDPNFGHVTV